MPGSYPLLLMKTRKLPLLRFCSGGSGINAAAINREIMAAYFNLNPEKEYPTRWKRCVKLLFSEIPVKKSQEFALGLAKWGQENNVLLLNF